MRTLVARVQRFMRSGTTGTQKTISALLTDRETDSHSAVGVRGLEEPPSVRGSVPRARARPPIITHSATPPGLFSNATKGSPMLVAGPSAMAQPGVSIETARTRNRDRAHRLRPSIRKYGLSRRQQIGRGPMPWERPLSGGSALPPPGTTVTCDLPPTSITAAGWTLPPELGHAYPLQIASTSTPWRASKMRIAIRSHRLRPVSIITGSLRRIVPATSRTIHAKRIMRGALLALRQATFPDCPHGRHRIRGSRAGDARFGVLHNQRPANRHSFAANR